MEIQTEPICTFDPNVNSGDQIQQNEELHNKEDTTNPLDIYSPTKQVYRSSNPFDVNYIPTGVEEDSPSPEKEIIQTSIVQKTTVYTTSRSLEKKHDEYRRNALAPIDPDFHQQLQEKLERDSPSDKKAQDEEKSYHLEEIQQFETETVNLKENSQGLASNKNQGNLNPGKASEQANMLSSLTNLSLDSIPNLQETIMNSMKALQNMDPQQQNELLATITVLQGNHPSQAPKVISNENSMKEPFRNRQQQPSVPQRFNQFNQGKQPIRPNFQNQNNNFINNNKFPQNKENFRKTSEAQIFPSVEKLEEVIEEHQLNAISVLNEFRLKIKKPIDYHIKELVLGRTRLFECTCLLNRQTIGQQRAGSKHSAKTEAAKEGLSTLLNSMSTMFLHERTALVSVLQRMSGKQLLQNNKPQFPNKFVYNNSNNRYPPHWQARSADGSREFNNFEGPQENSNQHDNRNNEENVFERVEIENGEVVEGIQGESRENTHHIEYNDNTENIENDENTEVKVHEVDDKTKEITMSQTIQEVGVHLENEKDVTDSNVKRSYFETCLEDQYFEDLQNDNEFSKENIQNLNRAFEQYLLTHIEKCQQNQFVMQTFREIFSRIIEFISKEFEEGKAEELAEGETHFTEYIERYNLVPVGSFALECMRVDEPVLDSLLIFQEKKETNETEFLELLRCTLECAQNKIQETKSFGLKFNFKVQTQNERTFLEIEEENQGKELKMRIYLLNTTQISKQESNSLYLDKYDFSILHASRMFKCFEGMEKQYREFRRLLTIFRAWRNGNNLNYLRPEIIDAILVYNFFNTNSSNLANSIINCIMMLNSETVLKHILELNGKIYLDYYNGLSEESKQNLISVCSRTLNCISEQNFSDAKFF